MRAPSDARKKRPAVDGLAPLRAPQTVHPAALVFSAPCRARFSWGRLTGGVRATLVVQMGLLLKLLSTAAMGALDVWVGIFTGVALGLPPILSGAVSIASAVVGVSLVVLAGERLQRLIYRSRRLARRRERIERVWKRYGIPGLALQAPLLTGPLLATVLALGLGAPPRPLLCWMLASVVLWGAVLTGAAALGLSLFSG
jgi:Ca2+/H+ antiporter, TMEM165/GDT1 family